MCSLQEGEVLFCGLVGLIGTPLPDVCDGICEGQPHHLGCWSAAVDRVVEEPLAVNKVTPEHVWHACFGEAGEGKGI
jgi:hypothetical protein